MRVLVRLVLMLIFLAAVFGGIAYLKYEQIQQMQARFSQPPPPAVVEAADVTEEQWQGGLQAVGSLTAVNGIEVTTEISGTVSAISFESGQRVKEGDELVRLEDSVDQASLQALIADRELTREQFQRYSELLPQRAVSQFEYDEASAKFEAAKARVEEQQARIQKKVIRTPFSGVLGLRRVDIGQYIAAGTPIVSLNAFDPIYVDYTVAERNLPKVQIGRTVEVRVGAFPDRTFTGGITAIDSAVNPGSRSVDVRATLDNPDELLRPGMFADVRTLDPQPQQVVTVPRTAVSFNTFGDYVYRIVENDQGQLVASRQQVTTGQSRDQRVAVIEGLKTGDRVVATGLLKLRNGQSVQIKPDSTDQSQTAAGGADQGADSQVAAQ